MAQFNPDPNKPGWGTYVNDGGQAAYDYFPNLSPQTQALNPSATGPAAPLNFTGGASGVSSGGGANMSAAPEPTQSVQPDPNMSVAPPAVPATGPDNVPVPPGVHPKAGELLAALHKATLPPVSGVSTTTSSGRPKAAIAADKAALTSNLGAAQATNTDIGTARQARAETAAQGNENAAMSTALTGADTLNKNLSEQATNNKLLSDSLAEKDPAVDPRRLIHNLSTGGTLLTTVLAAISGGFAAAAGQKTNPALDAINSAIDQDIDSQKTEIESGRIRRGNLIQAYRERGMKLDQAELAARATITESTRRYADAQAQELGAAANSEDATLLNQGLQTQYTQQVQALNQSGEAHSQTTVERKAPVGAAADPIKRMGEIQDAVTKMRKNGNSEEQVAEFLKTQNLNAPANPPAAGAGKYNRDQSRLLAVNTDVKDKLQQYAQQNGFVYDAGSGQFLEGTEGGTKMVLPQAVSEQNASIQQNAESIADSIGLIQRGGIAPSDPQVHTIVKGLTASAAKVRLAALNSHWKAVNNVIEGVRQFPGGVDQNPGSEESP